MNIEDRFSRLAQEYARFRPQYLPELFEYLASVAPAHELAWDCATGNGQAAVALAPYFSKVVGTDASADQIAHAFAHNRVEYRVERAEKVSLETGTVDLVTVAAGVHWFDLDPFYAEVRRVLKRGGIIAVWSYHLSRIDPVIDSIMWKYYNDVLGEYWSEGIRYVEQHYTTIPFPFREIVPPRFELKARWNLDRLVGFIGSWSPVAKYLARNNHHPVEKIWDELRTAWGDPASEHDISWPLFMRVGKT